MYGKGKEMGGWKPKVLLFLALETEEVYNNTRYGKMLVPNRRGGLKQRAEIS